jgi:hypothetical protein
MHHAMNTYGGLKVKLHVAVRGERSVSYSSNFIFGERMSFDRRPDRPKSQPGYSDEVKKSRELSYICEQRNVHKNVIQLSGIFFNFIKYSNFPTIFC